MTTDALHLGPDADARVLLASGGRITSFGDAPVATPDGTRHVECAAGRMQPGAINAHTHIYSGLAPLGMPPPARKPANFVEILETVWWRLDRALDEATLRAAARYYVAESLLAGTTTLIDHHESPNFIAGSLDVLADACDELGIRAIVCFGATERNGGRDEARRGLAECRRFLETNRRPLVRGVVSLHASFTVSDETIREAGALCREFECPMHVHVAEDDADVRDAERRGYAGPLERLLELDALPPGSIMAHGVFLNSEQVRRAAEAGIWLVQNPRSNRGNEVGYPVALAASSLVALGTDGYPARLEEEAEVLRQEAREHDDDAAAVERRISDGHRLVAELFGLELAPLASDGAADIVVRESGEARHVVVGGRLVVEDGALVTGDRVEILAEAETQAARLWQRMESLAVQVEA